MEPRQYKPFSLEINNINLIVYPVKDENPLKEVIQTKHEIIDHLNQLYSKQDLTQGRYHILFVWNLEGHIMTDVWIHKLENWSDSGPLLEIKTFRDFEECTDAGIASGDSIIALGREEELRRKLGDLNKYFDRELYIPDFPEGFAPNENF